jgi:hypothetical protein
MELSPKGGGDPTVQASNSITGVGGNSALVVFVGDGIRKALCACERRRNQVRLSSLLVNWLTPPARASHVSQSPQWKIGVGLEF